MEVKNKYINQLLNNISKEHKDKALNNFVANYNAGKIELPVSYNQYLNLKDIQSRIEALGLDKDEMWFLLLFIKDLADCIFDFEINNLEIEKKLNAIIKMFKAHDYISSSKSIVQLLIKFKKAQAIQSNNISMIIVFLFKYLDTREKRRSKKNEYLCDKAFYVKYLLESVFCHKEIDEENIRTIRKRKTKSTVISFDKYIKCSEKSKVDSYTQK